MERLDLIRKRDYKWNQWNQKYYLTNCEHENEYLDVALTEK